MRVITIDRSAPEATAIDEAADLLRHGGLVAFPTETVYGLGANALDASAVARIFAAKGRPSYNPLIVHVPTEAAARELAIDWPENASRLARAFWPGPLTVVLRKRSIVPDLVTAGLDSVALRVPAHPVALALLHAARIPLAAPSANRSMALSPTTAQHVARSLGDRVDLILDGGPTDVGIESTVVDLRGSRPTILRPGLLGARALEPVVGALGVPNDLNGESARPAPGMLDRHYAPRAELRLFDASQASHVARDAATLIARGTRVAILALGAPISGAGDVFPMPDDPARYAQRLYATLHDVDEKGYAVVFVERVPDDDAWSGVRDRLERASRTPPTSA
jgi:L-threonylcarbamoyladenylate synthase